MTENKDGFIKSKLEKLFSGGITFKKRLVFSSAAAFALSFTFIFFGVLDIYINNVTSFDFYLKDIIFPLLATGAVFFIFITVLFMMFEGKSFDYVISAGAGILLAGYLQGNFLNINFGELTGDAIHWEDYSFHSAVNLFIWPAIILLFILVRQLNTKIWRGAVFFVPVLLVFMQTAGLVSSAVTNGVFFRDEKYFLSTEGVYNVSENENILVFIIDRLDGKYVDQFMREYPEYLDGLDGFTYYGDSMSMYCRSFPSVTSMLTGNQHLYDRPSKEYFSYAWGNSPMISMLRENNYTTKFYDEQGYTYYSANELKDQFDNILEKGKIKREIKTIPILKNMFKLSAFRYMPHIAKKNFWITPSAFNGLVSIGKEQLDYNCDDIEFYQRLKANGVKAGEKKNNFMYYHFAGCHAPYTISENGERVPESETSLMKQTKGVFLMIYDYIDQLKALGLYDNASIIITGDHGKSEDWQSPDTYKTTGLFIKKKGDSGEKLKFSDARVSHEDFMATVAELAGIETDRFGDSVFDIEKNGRKTPRKFYYYVTPGEGDRFLVEFEVDGDARDFKNWIKLGETYAVRP